MPNLSIKIFLRQLFFFDKSFYDTCDIRVTSSHDISSYDTLFLCHLSTAEHLSPQTGVQVVATLGLVEVVWIYIKLRVVVDQV